MVVFIIAILIMGILLLGSSVVAWQAHRRQVQLTGMYDDTLSVLVANNHVRIGALNALRGERGYLLTNDEGYLEPYKRGREEMFKALDKLDALSTQTPEQRRIVAALRRQTAAYLRHIDTVDTLNRTGQHDAAMAEVMTGHSRVAIEGMDRLLDAISTREKARLDDFCTRSQQAYTLTIVFAGLVALTGFGLLVMAAISLFALNRSLEREKSYRRELQKLALTDELTALANRRAFLTELDRAAASARRSSAPLAVAIFDIDHFKRINDEYGHLCGDEALREVARRASACMRGGDLVARIGGEEFAVLLPATSTEAALVACERLRKAMTEHPVPLGNGTQVRLTISTGLAEMRGEDSAEQTIARADAALYAAKQDGRDMVRRAA
ncbi:diguanylate cyclase [Novosphingobium sp. 9]|uniref:diguanylate cyclase n=1 Tax=Novosphingobium sp. 9 TaxID=2025349 RepID=UPI0021B548D4|nr:diguanylate cyclase [Novosphingobium sp. 9]